MATNLEGSIRNAAAKIVEYIDDAATMSVDTKYVRVAADGETLFEEAKPAARSIVKLDGDSESIVPLQETPEGRQEVDAALLELHRANVNAAIEYRARMLGVLVDILKQRT